MTELDARAPSAELAAALAAVQAELPAVQKNRTADVQSKEGRKLYSYSYADLSDVSAAILPILGKHGLAFAAFPGHEPNGKFGLRYYLLHSSGDHIEGFYEIDDHGGMQMVGGRITYARRYCLSAVTGVAAEDDVDARGDGQTRTARRQPPANDDDGSQQPTRTAQRRPRATNASPAQAAHPVAAEPPHPPQAGAGEALPPLPGEEGATPDDTDFDTPGTATEPQVKAIVTILSKVFGVDSDEQSRAVCAHIAEREITSRKNLSKNEAAGIIDTLSHWQKQAKKEEMEARTYMFALMAAQEAAREQDAAGEPGE